MGSGESENQYETKLSPDEERGFAAWKKEFAPKDSGQDYDLRGAFKSGVMPDAETGHWPDTFKKPNHPTFSDQSMYFMYAPQKAGHWDGDTFIPPHPQPESKFEGGGGTFRPVTEPRYEHPVQRTEHKENAFALPNNAIFAGMHKDQKIYDYEALARLLELLNQQRAQKPYGTPDNARIGF